MEIIVDHLSLHLALVQYAPLGSQDGNGITRSCQGDIRDILI